MNQRKSIKLKAITKKLPPSEHSLIDYLNIEMNVLQCEILTVHLIATNILIQMR